MSSFAFSKNDGRRTLALMLFSGCCLLYAMRVNLSVVIVAMVGIKKDIIHETTASNADDYCPIESTASELQRGDDTKGEFNWDEPTQGKILGSFFWGYALTNFLGGILATRFGGRLVFGMGVTLTAILTLITPLAARHSTGAFLTIRVMEGMTEGVTFPAANMLLVRWVPASSRSRFLSVVLSGCQFGTVITMVVSGALCHSWAGWPSVFFVTGGIGILWGFLWFPLISDSPPTDGGGGAVPDDNKSLLSVPWRSILSSPAFLSLVLTHACANWGFYCLLTEMPSYLGHVLHFDVYTNGLVSSLPYLTKWLVMVSFSFWIDRSMERGRFSLRTARRMASLIALVTPALLLASIQLGGCNKIVVVLLLCLAVGISGTDSSGFLCAYQELAPNYAGVLAGLGNTVATLPGFLAPQLTGYLTEDQQSRSSWRQVFLVASALYLLGAAVYITFMSTKVQPWNDPSHGRKEDSEQACPLSDVNTDANA